MSTNFLQNKHQIWDAVSGITSVFDDFLDEPSAREGEERQNNDLARMYPLNNERLYQVEDDGRLKREATSTRKRALDDVGLDLFRASYQATFTASSTRAELSRRTWHDFSGNWNWKRKRSKSQPPAAQYGRLQSLVGPAGHNQAMSGDSPGHRRARRPRHSKDQILDELPTEKEIDFEASAEIRNSADSYVSLKDGGRLTQGCRSSPRLRENEGTLISATRIKPNTGQKRKVHSSEYNAVIPTLEEAVTSTLRDAHEETHSEDRRDASQSQVPSWGSQWRGDNRPKIEPDYSPPNTGRPPVPTPPPHPRMHGKRSYGAFVPTNRLLVQPENSPYKRSRLSEHGDQKAFNLSRGEYNPGSNKLPNLERAKSYGSSQEIFDIDSQTTSNQRRESFTARSGQSLTQNGNSTSNGSASRKGVEEFRRVEDMMRSSSRNPRNRRRNDEERPQGQSAVITTKSRFLSNGTTIVNMGEDTLDPIIDDFEEREMPPPRMMKGEIQMPRVKTSRRVQVEIPYQGTAHHKPARPSVQSSADRSISEGHASRYFPQDSHADQTHSNGNEFVPFRESATKARGRTLTRQPDDSFKAIDKRSSKASPDFAHSPDQLSVHSGLSAEDPHSVADKLLSRNRRSKGQTASTRQVSHPVDLTSEDELQSQGDPNITPVEFLPSKKGKQRKPPSNEQYDVHQVFSQGQVWLQNSDKIVWSLGLSQNDKNGKVYIIPGDHSARLTLPVDSIRKVFWYRGSPDVIIHKSIDNESKNEFNGDSHIHLTLGDLHQRQRLVDHLQPLIGDGNTIHKDGDHIKNIFSHQLAHAPKETKIRRPPLNHLEVDLLEHKSASRTAVRLKKANDATKPVGRPRKIDAMNTEEEVVVQRENARVSRLRNTRSSAGPLDFQDDLSVRRSPIKVDDFYGSSVQTGDHETRSSSRIANQESAPRKAPRARTPSPPRWTESNPSWSDDWKVSIVYPRQGLNRATVDKQDIQRLDEGQFLNDSLINFYLRWLEQRLSHENPTLAKRIYFFTSFFYTALTTATKRQRGINYEAVERWTSKVDLLSYDYIIVPVNEHTHWYVAIICNAPRLLQLEPKETVDLQTLKVDPSPGHISQEESGKDDKSEPSEPSPHTAQPSSPDVLDARQRLEVKSFQDLSLQDQDQDQATQEASKVGERQLDKQLDKQPGINPKCDPQVPLTSGTDLSRDMIARAHSSDEPIDRNDPSSVNNMGLAAEKKLTPEKKRGRRKSVPPAPRKHDPKEPRIITLDSLGGKHSPTCTNLRDYIVAEIKAKKGIDIPPPGSLGTTAMNIPQQTNYCDCGLFLLNYVEEFLKDPDRFVSDILQATNDIDAVWPNASDTRDEIRDILFKLQKEQVVEAEVAKKLKANNKKTAAANKLAKVTGNTESRDASESARNSFTPDRLKRSNAPSSINTPRASPEFSAHAITINRKRSASKEIDESGEDLKKSRKDGMFKQKLRDISAGSERSTSVAIYDLEADGGKMRSSPSPPKSRQLYQQYSHKSDATMSRQDLQSPVVSRKTSVAPPVAQDSGPRNSDRFVSKVVDCFQSLIGASMSAPLELSETPEKPSQSHEYSQEQAESPSKAQADKRGRSPEKIERPRPSLRHRLPTPGPPNRPRAPSLDHEVEQITIIDSQSNNGDVGISKTMPIGDDEINNEDEMLLTNENFASRLSSPDLESSISIESLPTTGSKRGSSNRSAPTTCRPNFQPRDAADSAMLNGPHNINYSFTRTYTGKRTKFPE